MSAPSALRLLALGAALTFGLAACAKTTDGSDPTVSTTAAVSPTSSIGASPASATSSSSSSPGSSSIPTTTPSASDGPTATTTSTTQPTTTNQVDFDTTFSGAFIDFGFTPVESSVSETVQVRASSNTRTVTSIKVTGSAFKKVSTDCQNQTIGPSHSCQVVIAFRPPSPGPHQGTLQVRGSDNRLASISLRGTTQRPKLGPTLVPLPTQTAKNALR